MKTNKIKQRTTRQKTFYQHAQHLKKDTMEKQWQCCVHLQRTLSNLRDKQKKKHF